MNGVYQYLDIGRLQPRDVAMLLEPWYEDQDLLTGSYHPPSERYWTVGIHVRPKKHLGRGGDEANIKVTFGRVETETFTREMYPALVDRFEKEFG